MSINSPSMVSRPSIMDRTRPSMAALDYAPATADVTAEVAQADKVKIEPNFTRTSSPDASVRANSSPLNAVDTTEVICPRPVVFFLRQDFAFAFRVKLTCQTSRLRKKKCYTCKKCVYPICKCQNRAPKFVINLSKSVFLCRQSDWRI